MTDEVYTLGVWHALPGREDELVAAWTEAASAFRALPTPPAGNGTLLRSVDDPALHYSFGPWPSLAAVQEMRANPAAVAALDRLRALCDDARPGAFTVVARG